MYFHKVWTLFLVVHISCIINGTVAATGETSHVKSSSTYQSCIDQTALCFGYPENCVTTTNCQFLFQSHYDETSGFQLQLTASTIKADQYIAVGFSNKSVMSGIVLQCYQNSIPSESVARYSFNTYDKRHNSAIVNQTDVTGFGTPTVSYQNGQLNCQWTVSSSNKVKYAGIEWDFSSDKFFIQLATGPYNPALKKIQYHGDNRVSSSSAVSLKSNSTIHPSGSSNAVRWHASLMIFGWIGCVTVAILMARFTRDLWPEGKLFGAKYWFVVHRYLMVIGWLCIVASYVIIFVQYKGWNKTSAHSVIGMVAGILATLQIGNSFLRPAPDSKNRWIFDYGHWIVGNSAHLLAVANIVASGMKRSSGFFWLLIAYLFVYLLFSDLLKKLENRVRQSYSASKAAVMLQAAIMFAIGTVVTIVIALCALMFIKG